MSRPRGARLSGAARRSDCLLAGVLLLRCTAARIPLIECSEPQDCGEGRTCSPAQRCVEVADGFQRPPVASPPESSTEAPAAPAQLAALPPSNPPSDAGSDAAPAAPAAQLTPLVVDDFEDGDNLPRDLRLATWQHYSWSPAGQDVYSWVEAPGDDSNFSMHLRWNLLDVADGVTMYTGGGLRTLASNAIVDLSSYSRVVFSHRFDASGSCKPVPSIRVALGCPEFETAYLFEAPVSATWITVSLPFAEFQIPNYISDRGISMASCLAVADGISFGIGTDLLDGECSTGVLSLDSISFR